MAVPTIQVARNDGSSTVVNPNFEPNLAGNNRATANEPLPATITLGQGANSAAAVAGLYNTDAVLTLPGERPVSQQE